MIIQERRDSLMIPDIGSYELINCEGIEPWLQHSGYLGERLAHQQGAFPHLLHLLICFIQNHIANILKKRTRQVGLPGPE